MAQVQISIRESVVMRAGKINAMLAELLGRSLSPSEKIGFPINSRAMTKRISDIVLTKVEDAPIKWTGGRVALIQRVNDSFTNAYAGIAPKTAATLANLVNEQL